MAPGLDAALAAAFEVPVRPLEALEGVDHKLPAELAPLVAVPIGLGLGRLANFVNSELRGRVADVPWAIEFPNGGPFPRHPSQLYEALLEGLVLFLLLRFLTHSRLKLMTPRFVSGAFVSGYGLSRIFVEFFREPDRQLGYLFGGWLTMGMVLSVPMVLIGIWCMATARPLPRPEPA